MNIKLYNMSTENNRMDKTDYLTEIITITGTLRERTSVINPSILISAPITIENSNDVVSISQIMSSNYAYIGDFDRYYFVEDIISESNNLIRLDLSVDVLMSFKDELKELDVFCLKNEYNYNELLPDGDLPTLLEPDLINIERYSLYENNYDNFVIFPETSGETSIRCYVMTMLSVTSTYANEDFISNISSMLRPYLLTPENFYDVSQVLLSGDFTNTAGLFNVDDPSQNIVSIYMIPFNFFSAYRYVNNFESGDLEKFFTYNERKVLPLGGNTAGFRIYDEEEQDWRENNHYLAQIKNSKPLIFFIGEFDLTSYGNKFYHYSGYSYLSIYIPYCGYIELPIDLCVGKYVTAHIFLDLCNGDTTLVIKSYTTVVNGKWHYDEIYYSGMPFPQSTVVLIQDIDLKVDIPLGKTNEAQKANQALMMGIKATVGLGLAVATGGVGGAVIAGQTALSLEAPRTHTKSGDLSKKGRRIVRQGELEQASNAWSAASNAMNIASTATLDIIKSLQPNTTTRGNPQGVYKNSNLYYKPFLRFQKPKVCVDINGNTYLKKYNHTCGRVSDYVGVLKNLYGYTQLGGFHLEGLTNATTTEKEAIDSILRSGFLMPNPPTP